jgi:hypothetical protein
MDYTKEFKAFWQIYPPRYHEAGRPKVGGGYEHYWKIGKRLAMKQWKALTAYQKRWAMYSVQFMRKGKYVPDAHRWLRDGKFEDWDMPEEYETMPDEIMNTIKINEVPDGKVDVNNERNRQVKDLERKTKCQQ